MLSRPPNFPDISRNSRGTSGPANGKFVARGRDGRNKVESTVKRSYRNGLVAFALLGGMQSAAAEVISGWNDIGFIVDRKMPPPVAEQLIAMVQVAMLDAVNSIDRKYRPYPVLLPAEAAASREAAAATAYANLASLLMVAAATAAASLLAPATTTIIDVPAPTVEVLT
jgi:hypothetical protein